MDFVWLKKHDWIISLCICFLAILSLLLVYSTTYNATSAIEGAGAFPRQIGFLILGFIIYFVLIYFDIEWLRQKQVLAVFYIILIISLLFLLTFGNEVAGTQRWIQIGFINIQPSEYAKILIILITSLTVASNKSIRISNLRNSTIQKFIAQSEVLQLIDQKFSFYIVSFILVSPILLFVFLQPSLGNAMILGIIWLTIIFLSSKYQSQILMSLVSVILITVGIYKLINLTSLYSYFNISLIINNYDLGIIGLSFFIIALFLLRFKFDLRVAIISILVGISMFPMLSFAWNNVLQDYQKTRVTSYFEGSQSDPYGAGYQVNQAKIAAGSGKLWGKGFLKGSQTGLRLLDLSYTDFIFASFAEQFGFRGAIILLSVYLILLIRIIRISLSTDNVFYSLICIGVGSMILLNLLINVGMNIGILPVTGVPLPLISYGGNSVFVNLIGLGIVQSINYRISLQPVKQRDREVNVASESTIDWSGLEIR